MKVTSLMLLLICLLQGDSSMAFTPSSCIKSTRNQSIQDSRYVSVDWKKPMVFPESSHLEMIKASKKVTPNEDSSTQDLTLNPLYAIPYILFFSVATYMTIHEGSSGASQGIINAFIADPLHPNTGSSLFEVVFNTLGLVGLPMACLLMPAAKNQKFSATPFLFGSSLAGYGSLGLYMMTRTPQDKISLDDLGWFTKNVLENKIFNWLLVAALLNIYIITGAYKDLSSDFSGTFATFFDTITKSALGLTSTVDLTILCLTAASLIPEDLARRGMNDKGNASAIAASTLLFPAVGVAVYCAMRPPLKDE